MNNIVVEQNGKNCVLQIDKQINNIKEVRILFKGYDVQEMQVEFFKNKYLY